MITMLLGGLWHGADWTFVFWGFMHGIALVVHKIFLLWKKKYHYCCTNKVLATIGNGVSVILTYCYVCVGWVFFRAETINQAVGILKQIGSGADGISYIYSYLIVYAVLLGVCYFYGVKKNGGQGTYPILQLEKFWSKVIVCTIIGVILVFSYQGNNVFVYFQF